MKIGNFEITRENGWFVEDISIRTRKVIREQKLDTRHGIDFDNYAYFDGLEITISGKCKIQPATKNKLINVINYGIVHLEFDDGYYIVENKNVNFKQSVNIPDVEIFQLEFISPTPYKYKNEITKIETTVSNFTKLIVNDSNIKLQLDDVNFIFENQDVNMYYLCTRNYRLYSIENDNGQDLPVNENYLTYFDIYKNSIVAKFDNETYISRFYLFFDEILTTSLFKTDIEITFYDSDDNEFKTIPNDYFFKTVDAISIGLPGTIYAFYDINVETSMLKLRYVNSSKGNNYKYTNDFTRRNLAIVIPDYNTFLQIKDYGKYFLNSQKGIVLKNSQKDIYAINGQFLRLYPNKTYAYCSDGSVDIKIIFNNYNFYGVEHV